MARDWDGEYRASFASDGNGALDTNEAGWMGGFDEFGHARRSRCSSRDFGDGAPCIIIGVHPKVW